MLANGNVETAVSNPFFLKKYFGDHHVHAILRCFFQGTAPGASEINGKNELGRTSGPSANGITSHRFFFLKKNMSSFSSDKT
jgi:hypothetical protein